jgi:hypothetical protein
VLNRRLPGITARDVLSIVPSGDHSSVSCPTYLIRVETFPGAACLKRFAVSHASKQISWVSWVRPKAAPLQPTPRPTASCR